MNAYSGISERHPHVAAIPDPRTEGVRAYREPDVPHPLQLAFLDEDGERAFVDEIRELLADGRAAEADMHLSTELAGLDGGIARICKALPSGDVVLEGWDDLLPILSEWEGPPITAITLGLTNPPDLVFDGGQSDEPDLLISLYSDDAFPFGQASKAEILAECAKEAPGWIDAEEDVEFYCGISGLAALNGALVHCKHRHFLRDGRDGVEGRAPGGYVEFVLGSWLLATRFLQAVQCALAEHALPESCRLVVGTIGLNSDFVCILGQERSAARKAKGRSAAAPPEFATLRMKQWVPREEEAVENRGSASTFRQRVITVEPPSEDTWLSRLLGRFTRPR